MIDVDYTQSKLIDLLLSLKYTYNFEDVMEDFRDTGVDLDPDIVEAYHYVTEDIDKNRLGLQLFFANNPKNYCLMTSYYAKLIWNLNSIDNFIRDFKNRNREELKVAMLSFYDNKNRSDNFYEDILNYGTSLIDFVYKLKLQEKLKWKIIEFTRCPDKYIKSLSDLLETTKYKIDKIYKDNYDKIQSVVERFKIKASDNEYFFTSAELAKLSKLKDVNIENYEKVSITPSFINETFLYSVSENGALHIMLGVNYEKSIGIYSVQPENINSLKALKALSDEYRIKIIQMLRGRSLCASRIAENVNLSRSAVSYHLLELSQMGILKSRKKGKQRFYTTDQVMLNKIVDVIKGMLYRKKPS